MPERITLSPKGFRAFGQMQGSEEVKLADGRVVRRGEDGLYREVPPEPEVA